MVDHEQTVYFVVIGSAPFGRPQPNEVLDAIKNYLSTGGLRRRGHYVPD